MVRPHLARLRAAAGAAALTMALAGVVAVAPASPASASYGIPVRCPTTDPGGRAGYWAPISNDEEILDHIYTTQRGALVRSLESPRGPTLTCFYRGMVEDDFYHQTMSYSFPYLWPTVYKTEVRSQRTCSWWVQYTGPSYTRTSQWNWVLSDCQIPAEARG